MASNNDNTPNTVSTALPQENAEKPTDKAAEKQAAPAENEKPHKERAAKTAAVATAPPEKPAADSKPAADAKPAAEAKPVNAVPPAAPPPATPPPATPAPTAKKGGSALPMVLLLGTLAAGGLMIGAYCQQNPVACGGTADTSTDGYGGGSASGRCSADSPAHACAACTCVPGHCNPSSQCGGGDCWTSSSVPPFCN